MTASAPASGASTEFITTSQAHRDRIHTLYKFMSYPTDGASPIENAERRRRVDALLLDGELYFPTALELNDPFEAAPQFSVPTASPDELLQIFSRNLRNVYAPKWGWSEEQIVAREINLQEEIRTNTLHMRLMGVAHKWRETFRTDFPMCCFAATRESTLMWSYYSGGHTGICVHIDATRAPIANAERVVYSERYPELSMPLAELEPEAIRTLALLIKSSVWCHEHEYRLINLQMTYPPAARKRVLDDLFRWKTPQLAVIPSSLVLGVTIGASMADTEIETILRICHDRRTKVPVFQAKCKQDRFELEFSPIT